MHPASAGRVVDGRAIGHIERLGQPVAVALRWPHRSRSRTGRAVSRSARRPDWRCKALYAIGFTVVSVEPEAIPIGRP